MHAAALMAVATILWACSPAPEPPSAADTAADALHPVVSEPTAAERAACERRGGGKRSLGMFGGYHCVVPYADAGRPCSDGSQCQGDCRSQANLGLAPGQPARGFCQADSNNFGCNTSISGGKAEAALCVD